MGTDDVLAFTRGNFGYFLHWLRVLNHHPAAGMTIGPLIIKIGANLDRVRLDAIVPAIEVRPCRQTSR